MLIPNFKITVGKPQQQKTTTKSANIQSIRVDHNVYQGNVKGMRIHVKAVVVGCTDVKCDAVVFFNYKGGTRLKDYNGKYVATDGTVSVQQGLNAMYETSQFDDIPIFMPYDELHMGQGSYQLEFDVHIHHTGSKCMAHSEKVYFDYSS